MPRLNRLGNPILSGFLNLLFHTGVRDVHCGMRALRRDALPRLRLRTAGMEFAADMVIRAAKIKRDVRELPIELHRRGGESKLSPFRDGWRHLRLILVYNPTFLFMLPGAILAAAGLSFLGLGVTPPTAEWGAMLSEGRNYLPDQWWIAVFPGCAIALTVLGINLIGDGLRDTLDPRLHR